MLDSLYFLMETKLKRIKSYVDTTVTSAINSLSSLKANKAGDEFTGEMKVTGNRQVTVGDYGHFSSGTSGEVLVGQNCYIDKTTNKIKYLSTHANMGARGVLYKFDTATNAQQPWFFDTGRIATTKDAEFTPVLKKLWHEGNLQADTFATTFAKKTGDTYTGTHTMNGKLDVNQGTFRLPVGTDKWAT